MLRSTATRFVQYADVDLGIAGRNRRRITHAGDSRGAKTNRSPEISEQVKDLASRGAEQANEA